MLCAVCCVFAVCYTALFGILKILILIAHHPKKTKNTSFPKSVLNSVVQFTVQDVVYYSRDYEGAGHSMKGSCYVKASFCSVGMLLFEPRCVLSNVEMTI